MYYLVLHIFVLDPDLIPIQLDQQTRIFLSNVNLVSKIFALKSLGLHPKRDWIRIQKGPGKS